MVARKRNSVTKQTPQFPQLDHSSVKSYNHSLVSAFNWYNLHWDADYYKKYAIESAESNNNYKEFVPYLKRADYLTIRQIAVYFALLDNCQELKKEELTKLNNLLSMISISNVVHKVKKQVQPNVVIDEKEQQFNIKSHNAMAEVEDGLDEVYLQKKIPNNADKIVMICDDTRLKKYVSEQIKKKLDVYEKIQLGEDEELVEAYSNYNKRQLKLTIDYLNGILSTFDKLRSVKPTSTKTVRKRPQTPQQITKKMTVYKTLPEFKIICQPAHKIVGSSAVYVYFVENRKLVRFVPMKDMSLSANGMSIVNFDPEKTVAKTLRKPEVFFEQFKNSKGISKTELKKAFDSVAGQTKTYGTRLNDKCVILSA